MKIKFKCSECDYDDYVKKNDIMEMELANENYYEVQCKQGHKSHYLLNQEKYEMLFEVGCLAYLDGYYREAVTSFSAALENFRVFCIEIFTISNGISVTQLNIALNSIKLSERQIGAFNILYLNYFKEPIPKETISKMEKWSKFRNAATHAGMIPKSEKVWEYAEFVHDFIQSIVKKLKQKDMDLVINRYYSRKDEQIEHMKLDRNQLSNYGLLSVLNLSSNRDESLDFSIKLLKGYRNEFYTR